MDLDEEHPTRDDPNVKPFDTSPADIPTRHYSGKKRSSGKKRDSGKKRAKGNRNVEVPEFDKPKKGTVTEIKFEETPPEDKLPQTVGLFRAQRVLAGTVQKEQPHKAPKEHHLTVVTDDMKLNLDVPIGGNAHVAKKAKGCTKGDTVVHAPKRSPSQLQRMHRREVCLAWLTLATNFVLLLGKGAAVWLSGSMSIISSLVDSGVDVTAGIIIWITTVAARRRHDQYAHLRTKTKMEPLALIIISVIRAVASTQVIIQAAHSMMKDNIHPSVPLETICIMAAAAGAKVLLALLCCCNRDLSSVRFMGHDNFSDALANLVALGGGYVGANYWKYADPIGAILISLYIAITWCIFGYTHAVSLSGRRAEAEYINGIIKLCSEHDERIVSLDTVFVYHWSTKFFVEVHLVFPKHMTVEVAHNIAHPLQQKIERLSYVERAFISIDYKSQKCRDSKNRLLNTV